MKKLIEKRNLIQPVKVDESLQIAVDETIDDVAWTAAMPKGELAKLKKVCKPVASRDGITFWVIDETKTKFIQK